MCQTTSLVCFVLFLNFIFVSCNLLSEKNVKNTNNYHHRCQIDRVWSNRVWADFSSADHVKPPDFLDRVNKHVKPPDLPPIEFTFVHVGKTGGTSLSNSLRHSGFCYRVFHLCQANQTEMMNTPVLISVRDPLSRLISVWNYRKFICTNEPSRCRSIKEVEFIKKCSFNDVIEALRAGDNETLCGQVDTLLHWVQDHRWYLRHVENEFIDSGVYPLRQTNMVEDFKDFCEFSGIGRDDSRCQKVAKQLSQTHDNISPKSLEPLPPSTENFLKEEYLKEEIDFYNFLLRKIE